LKDEVNKDLEESCAELAN